MAVKERTKIRTSFSCTCGAAVKLQSGTVEHVINGSPIRVHNVPHYVCEECGRITYDIETNVFDVLMFAAKTGRSDIDFTSEI